ncbi:hypothetical protein TNCT_276321 [Trichonephila clavata]|uniref:Uncharacterized protein n=1 Tax=Trichonephila clavata TaxID=2740835 RepID=A0A8X6JQ85_TRICU|nr:hypothetical protein TNCT_276321 [Trichonephila clavata]
MAREWHGIDRFRLDKFMMLTRFLLRQGFQLTYYMEELTQVGADEVTPKILRQFLLPYCRILCCSDDYTFLTCIEKDIFLYLINQEADEEDFGEFPVLQFKPTAVQKLLMKFANKLDVKRKNRRVIHSIVKGIENYKNGINVFEDALERHFDDTVKPLGKKDVKKAALDLLEEEKKYKELKKAYKKKKVHTDKE